MCKREKKKKRLQPSFLPAPPCPSLPLLDRTPFSLDYQCSWVDTFHLWRQCLFMGWGSLSLGQVPCFLLLLTQVPRPTAPHEWRDCVPHQEAWSHCYVSFSVTYAVIQDQSFMVFLCWRDLSWLMCEKISSFLVTACCSFSAYSGLYLLDSAYSGLGDLVPQPQGLEEEDRGWIINKNTLSKQCMLSQFPEYLLIRWLLHSHKGLVLLVMVPRQWHLE